MSNPYSKVLLVKATRTATSVISDVFTPNGVTDPYSITFYLDVDASGTGTLDGVVEVSPDNVVWYNLKGTDDAFTQVGTGAGKEALRPFEIAPFMRVNFTQATSPSHTFGLKVSWVQKGFAGS